MTPLAHRQRKYAFRAKIGGVAPCSGRRWACLAICWHGLPAKQAARVSPCPGDHSSTGEPSRTAPSSRKYRISFETLPPSGTSEVLKCRKPQDVPPQLCAQQLPPAPPASFPHLRHPSRTSGIPPVSLAPLLHLCPQHPSCARSIPPVPCPSTGMCSLSQRACSLPRQELLGSG